MRVMKLRVVFKDSPNPWTIENVTNMTTEGPLLRLTVNKTENTWYPLENIFSVKELERTEVVPAV